MSHPIPINALRTWAVVPVIFLMAAPVALAQGEAGPEASTELTEAELPRHRLDSSFAFLDTLDLNSLHLIFAYTYSLTPHANLSVVLPFVDGDAETPADYGPGDLGIAFSFAPYSEIAPNPWVPKTVGTGLAAIFPTGNTDKNRGQGIFVLNPFVGGVWPLSDRLFATPQLGYSHSLNKTEAGVLVRIGSASIGLTFVSFSGFWIAPLVEFARDFHTNKNFVNFDITMGKMFSSGLGVSVTYLDYELRDVFTGAGLRRTGDREIAFQLHVTF